MPPETSAVLELMHEFALSLASSLPPGERGIILYAADSTMQACNPTAQRILGLAPDQLHRWNSVDRPWPAIHVDGSPFAVADHPARVTLQTGQPCSNVEMGWYQVNGDLVWLLISTEPLFQMDDVAPYAVVVTFAEIPAPHGCPAADSTLAKPENFLSLTLQGQAQPETGSEEAFFFDQSLDLLSVIGFDGYFKRINAAFTKTLGYSEAELLATPFIEFIDPADHPATLVEMERLNAGAPTLYFENRYVTKDGSYRWLSWTASPQLDRGVMYCVARDVTQQKEIEAALKQAHQELEQRVVERTAQLEQANTALAEREALYRALAHHIPNGAVHLFDHDLRYLLMTGSELEKLGFDGATLVGKTMWEVLPPETCAQIEPMYRAALAGQASVEEVPYQNQIYEVHTLPVRTKQGKIFAGLVLTQNMTHRKQAEAGLRESQAMLQRQLNEIEAIYQSAPIGLNVLDADLRFVRINQRLAEMNGLPVEAHIGRTIRELLPEIADTAEKILRPILETGEPLLNIEITGETPAQPGMQRVWLESFLPLKEGNRVIGINVVCEEITERKQAAEALRRSEERYRTLFTSMEDGFCVIEMVFDPNHQPIDYRFLEVNPAFERQSGLEEAQGRLVSELLPNLEEHWFEIYGRVALTGEPARFENGVQTLNRWFDVHAFRIGEPEQRRVAVLFKDISDRKHTETVLRENEDRLRMAVASAQLGTWDWNLITGELKWDTACKAMFGLPPDAESSIEVFFGRLHPDDRDRLQEIVQTVLDPASGGAYDAEFRTVGTQGNIECWIRAKGQAYYDVDGKPLRFIGTVLNITEQKQVAVQRERLLQQEQAAREAAEHANRIKDEFLAILSHELRTPLNPILGWSKLLQSPKISAEKLQQGLTTIERNARQQVQLIDDLLDISRIIRGKLALKLATVNLSEPITAALETIRLAAEAKAIQIEVCLDPSVGPVRGDQGRLQQVLWNLLSNAVKFTPTSGQVTVRLTQVACHAQIIVSDTGKGIKPDFLPHVFELFRQQDSSTTRTFGGLGLGLAIARQVVEAHGGTIIATSTGEGQGTTFTVQLPLMPKAQPNAPQCVKPQAVNIENLRVMVVDDEIDSLEVLKALLEQEGAKVTTVASGPQALRMLTESHYDLLISDIGMPDMDGYAFMRHVRTLALHHNREIPAIALTAYATEIDQRQSVAAGFQAHLPKPIDPEQLMGAIAMVMVQ